MWLKNLNDYENPENAEKQFDIIVANCKYMLWKGDNYKDVLDLPEELKDNFNISLQRMQDRGMLALIAILQKSITSAYLLLEEWHDFTQYEWNLKAMLDAVKARLNEEDTKEESFEMFVNAKEAVKTGGMEPPHEDMIRAKDYFKGLAQEKLDKELAENYIPYESKDGIKHIPRVNYTEKLWDWEDKQAWEIKLKIDRSSRGITNLIEIVEWEYAGEQFFYTGNFQSTIYRKTAFLRDEYRKGLPNQNHAFNEDFIKAFLDSIDVFPWIVEVDDEWNIEIIGQWERARYAFINKKDIFSDSVLSIEVYNGVNWKEFMVLAPEWVLGHRHVSLKFLK